MDPIKNLIDGIESQTEGAELVNDMKVVKTVKATKEEVELQEKMHKECDKLYKMLQDINADRQKFWAMVQLRLDSFEADKLKAKIWASIRIRLNEFKHEHLNFNKKTGTIDFVEKAFNSDKK